MFTIPLPAEAKSILTCFMQFKYTTLVQQLGVARNGQRPTLNVPIQSNAIAVRRYYTVAARGNTKHYLYDNVTYITLNGNFSDQG